MLETKQIMRENITENELRQVKMQLMIFGHLWMWLKLKVWIRITKGTIASNTIWEPYTEQNHNDIVTTFT